jgi:hypothetical protein
MARSSTSTVTYGGIIAASDPATGTVQVTTAGGVVQVLVDIVPVLFRWPVVGEHWMVRQENGTWLLDSLYQDSSSDAPLSEMEPGQAQINATETIDSSGNQFVTVDVSTFPDGYLIGWDATTRTFVPVAP